MSLSHLEVLSEVLVSAPPVGVDKVGLLVLPDLMEVRVSNVVLLPISRHSSVGVGLVEHFVGLSDAPSPLSNHALLLGLTEKSKSEGLVKVPNKDNIKESNSVLALENGGLPEGVGEGIFVESSNVLEGSPFLGHVSGLLGLSHEFGKISVSFFGKCSANHVSSFIHVGVAVHEALDTSKSLSEVGLGVLSIVQILRHY